MASKASASASAAVATSSALARPPSLSTPRGVHPCHRRDMRRYATTRASDELPPWPQGTHPSPYEVLGMSRDAAAYDKRAYYRLAKLYHPDSHASSSSSSSAATRLERYRALVAAHELLSDPGRRRLYDTTGAGWTRGHGAPSLRDLDRSWRAQPGNAANNATWEDWQRWREAREGRETHTSHAAYMPHGAFASIVVALCAVGWSVQAGRAGSAGDRYSAWAAQQDAAIGGRLARESSHAAGRSRDQRVEHFVRDRENTLYGYQPKGVDKPP